MLDFIFDNKKPYFGLYTDPLVKIVNVARILEKNNLRSVSLGYGILPKYIKDILGKISSRAYEFADKFTKWDTN